MKRKLMLPAVAVAIFGLMAAFATSAQAHPTYAQACTGCHPSTTAITVSLTQSANNGTNATYNITVSNPYGSAGWAVFNGATRLAGASGTTGSFVVADGGTYTVYGAGAGSNMGARVVTLKPVAPPAPPVPNPPPAPNPTTTPDPTTTPAPTGDPTTTPAPVTPPVAPKMYKCRVHVGVKGHSYWGRWAILTSVRTGGKWVAKINKAGYATFSDVVAGKYRLTLKNKSVKFKARILSVPIVPAAAHHDSERD